jgi:hypothetical protein
LITGQRGDGAKGSLGVIGFYVGTEAAFSSKGRDPSKVGKLNVGTIVPVRFDADHAHAALDVP